MNTDTKHIKIKDYDYPLPDEKIAKYPIGKRDQSKLLIYNKGEVSEDVFCNIASHLPKGALMIFNNTRVIQARLHFRKATGALIEVFLLEPASPADYEQMFQSRGKCSWLCLVGNLKKWKEGVLNRELEINGVHIMFQATRMHEQGTSHWVDFKWDYEQITFADIPDVIVERPIPPYLNRKTQDSDKISYQTVYSKIKGSVAAPTAGLHFTEEVLNSLDQHGIEREELTLHVGAGTFKPVKSEEIEGHNMHTEYISVKKSTLQKLIQHNAQAIAVGTTSVRTLESLYYIGCHLEGNPNETEEGLHVKQWTPYDNNENQDITVLKALQNIVDWLERNDLNTFHGSTQIIIAPGYEYKIVRMLVTNFHQPQSTLLLLVSAFVHGDWRRIYDYALGHNFRFLSYGDSSLLIP